MDRRQRNADDSSPPELAPLLATEQHGTRCRKLLSLYLSRHHPGPTTHASRPPVPHLQQTEIEQYQQATWLRGCAGGGGGYVCSSRIDRARVECCDRQTTRGGIIAAWQHAFSSASPPPEGVVCLTSACSVTCTSHHTNSTFVPSQGPLCTQLQPCRRGQVLCRPRIRFPVLHTLNTFQEVCVQEKV